jgi:hypothetical protein
MPVKRRAGESDALFGARCYREQLRQEINMHTGAGRFTNPAPPWLRQGRASYLYERATGHGPPAGMTNEAIVEALVQMAYPVEERLEASKYVGLTERIAREIDKEVIAEMMACAAGGDGHGGE